MDKLYQRVTKHGHPNARNDGRIKRSRLLMSEHLNRPLEKDEHVHHINGNKTDDRIENLKLFNPSEHIAHHVKDNKHPMYKKDRTKVCLNCNKEFSREEKGSHFKRDKCCSRECSSQYHVKERANNVKLTQKSADEIKALKGILPSREIATKFNISPTQAKRILRGDAWA